MYTMCGMAKVEKEFESKLKDVKIDNKSESYKNKQLTFIYNFLKQVHNLQKMDDNKLKNEIELNRWGHMLEVIPRHKLKNVNVSYIFHIRLLLFCLMKMINLDSDLACQAHSTENTTGKHILFC